MVDQPNVVESWKIERAANPEYVVLSFTTTDGRETSFTVRDATLARMAELMGDFHIEAFPEGLQFH